MGQPKPKVCAVCGREIQWRKKWERNWAEVKYCSDACRRRGRSGAASGTDAALEQAILSLLLERGAGKTICPSEAARRVAPGEKEAWMPLMEHARSAARRLQAAGQVVMLQGGRPVDPSRAKGTVRLKLV